MTPLKLYKTQRDNKKNALNRCEELYDAVEKKDVEKVENILLSSSSIKMEHNYDIVHKAVALGSIEIMKVLLESEKIDPNYRNAYLVTPIQEAAYYGRLEVVKFLMRHPRVDVNAEDSSGGGALHRAVIGNQLEVVNLLLQEKRTDVLKQDKEGCNVLHRACHVEHRGKIIEAFMKTDAKKKLIETRNLEGNTPLHDLYLCNENKKYDHVIQKHIKDTDQYINLRNSRNESFLSLALEDMTKALEGMTKALEDTTKHRQNKAKFEEARSMVYAMLEKKTIVPDVEDLCRALNIDLQDMGKKAISLQLDEKLPEETERKLNYEYLQEIPSDEDYTRFVGYCNFKGFEGLDSDFVFAYNYLRTLTSMVEDEDVNLLKQFDLCNLSYKLQKPRPKEINHVLRELLPSCRLFRLREKLENAMSDYVWKDLKLNFEDSDKEMINTSFPLMCIILGKYKLVEPFFQLDNENEYILHCAFIMQVLRALHDKTDLPRGEQEMVTNVIAAIDQKVSFVVANITGMNKFVSRHYITEVFHSILGKNTVLLACIECGAEQLVKEEVCNAKINGLSQEAIDANYKTSFNLRDFFVSLFISIIYFPLSLIGTFVFIFHLFNCKRCCQENKSKYLPYAKRTNFEDCACHKFLSKCIEWRDVHIIPTVRFAMDTLFFLAFIAMISYFVMRELLFPITYLEISIYIIYVTYIAEEIKQCVSLYFIETRKCTSKSDGLDNQVGDQEQQETAPSSPFEMTSLTGTLPRSGVNLIDSTNTLSREQTQTATLSISGVNLNNSTNTMSREQTQTATLLRSGVNRNDSTNTLSGEQHQENKTAKKREFILKKYINDHWNQIDIGFYTFMIFGFAVRMLKAVNPEYCTNIYCEIRQANDPVLYAARILFIVGLILGYAKSLRLLSFNKNLGPKLIMIHEMIKIDLIPFFCIIMVFVFAFAAAFAGSVFPNGLIPDTYNSTSHQRDRFSIEKGFSFAFYGLVGDYTAMAVASGDEPEKSNEGPGHLSSAYIIPYLFLFIYVILMNILLLNLLIALFSSTFSAVEKESRLYWYQLKLDLVEEYKIRSVLPPPFNIFDMLFCLLKLCNMFQHLSRENRDQREKDVCLVFHFLQQKFFRSARKQIKKKIKRKFQTDDAIKSDFQETDDKNKQSKHATQQTLSTLVRGVSLSKIPEEDEVRVPIRRKDKLKSMSRKSVLYTAVSQRKPRTDSFSDI